MKNLAETRTAAQKGKGYFGPIFYLIKRAITLIMHDHLFLTKQGAENYMKDYTRFIDTDIKISTDIWSDSPSMEQFFAIIDDPAFWNKLISMLESKKQTDISS